MNETRHKQNKIAKNGVSHMPTGVFLAKNNISVVFVMFGDNYNK